MKQRVHTHSPCNLILTRLPTDSDRIAEYDMKLMDIDAENLGIPDTEYDARVTMPSGEFTRIVRDLSLLGESVRIEVSKEGVRFASEGEAANGSVLLKQTEAAREKYENYGKDDDEVKEEKDDEEEEENPRKKKIKKGKVKKEEKDGDVEMNGEDDDEGEFKAKSGDEGEDELEEDEDEQPKSKKRKKASSKVSRSHPYVYPFGLPHLLVEWPTVEKGQEVGRSTLRRRRVYRDEPTRLSVIQFEVPRQFLQEFIAVEHRTAYDE